MSRIGKQPIAIPAGVKVALENGTVKVEGKTAKLQFKHHPEMVVKNEDGKITVTRPSDGREHRALHGLTRALINNMIVGVTTGYTKRLKIEGVGYQAVAAKGKIKAADKDGKVVEKDVSGVELMVGFANKPRFLPPEGITCTVPDPQTIVVTGADKQAVGQFAAEIRAAKKPEPYKGKGVRYENEVVRRKEGKSFSAGK